MTQCPWTVGLTTSATRTQQLERIKPKPFSDPLDALQRQIPLPTLQPTHIRPVNIKLGSKRLLRQPKLVPVCAQILPNPALQLPLHTPKTDRPLLDGLQTHK